MAASVATPFAEMPADSLRGPGTREAHADDADRPELSIAIAHHRAGRMQEAEAIGRALLRTDPLDHQAMQLLAEVARARRRLNEAVSWLRQAVAVAPAVPEYFCDLGCVLDELGATAMVERAFREAVAVRPGFARGHRNLGIFLSRHGRREEALACHREAVRADPSLSSSHWDAAELLRALGQLDEAADAFRAALAANPWLTPALSGLGAVYRDQGRLVELIDVYRQMMERDPGCAVVHSDMVFTLHYDPRQTPQGLFEETVRWGRRHAAPRGRMTRPHPNDPTPGRRLRIGYVSPDLRNHVVGRLLRPVLAAHDRGRFEVFCYSDARWVDAFSHDLWKTADTWRDIAGMTDHEVDQLVRDDRIDILIEVCGHFGGNRLAMLGSKPAPVQVTHFGYCGTTGVESVDYRITDAYSDPPGQTERYHVEQLWRLPNNSWCYRPMDATPDVGPLPAGSGGRFTFGCLNGLVKVTDAAVETWSRILAGVPGSRLILLSNGTDEAYTRRRFARHGVDADRLELAGRRPRFDYMDLHNRMDVALDPFPFNGDNTTCDALWMGVPVVSLKGPIFAWRRSFSHLSNVGLGELSVESIEEYVRTAISLAGDLPRLAAIRASLRGRMEASPLCDAVGFTRNLEEAYRGMWGHWCERQTAARPAGASSGE